MTAPVPVVESFTLTELDQLAGSLLWLGRLHNSLASFLDVTYDPTDTGLIEWLNLAPVSMTSELLPTTALLLSEVSTRCEEIQRALAVAMDSAAERAAGDEVTGEFDKIIDLAFKRDAKKNGG